MYPPPHMTHDMHARYSGRNLGPSEGGEEGEHRRHLRKEACVGKPSTLNYNPPFSSSGGRGREREDREREEFIDNQQVTRESEGVV